MYWHIDTDIISIIIIISIYVYTVRLTSNENYLTQNRGFIWCLRTGIIMTAVDIVASVAMEIPFSRFLYHLSMSSYLLAIDLAIVSWFLYSLTILYYDNKTQRRCAIIVVLIPYIIYSIFACANPWTGIFYTLGPDMTYTRQALFIPIVAGLYAVYAVALLILIVIRHKHIPDGYPKGILFMQPIILAISIPVQLLNAGWLMVIPAYVICLVLAFLFFQNINTRNEREMTQQLTEMIENFSCGIAICAISRDRNQQIQYMSNGLAEIHEEDRDTLVKRYKEDLLTGVHPDDSELVQAYLEDMERTPRSRELTYRIVTKTGNIKHINVKSKVTIQSDGAATVYATFIDLTEQTKLQNQLSDVIQNVPCGLCIYRWDGDNLHPLIVNNRFTEMLGEDALEYLKNIEDFNYTHVHPDDLQTLKKESYRALTETNELNITYRSLNYETNKYLWVRVRGKVLDQVDGTQLVIVSYNDVTQEHHTEQQLRESEQAMEYAAEQAGLYYWRYDAINDRLYLGNKNREEWNLPNVMENFLTEGILKGTMHTDYIERYRDACLRIKAGERQVVFEARHRFGDGKLHWFRYCMTNLFNNEGKTSIAVGTAILIDDEKELWAKYELERKRAAMDEDNLIVHGVFNLTTGETLEYLYRDGSEVPLEDRTAFTYGEKNAELLIDENERREFLALNNLETLLEHFANGKSEFRMDYRRRLTDGKVIWVRNNMHLVRDPQNGDVLLFEYWYNIEEERMREAMYRSIASDNYDYVARINGRTKHFVVFSKPGLSYNMPPLEGEDADAVTYSLYDDCVLPEDREMAIENSLVANINKHLKEKGRFRFTYREKCPDGSIRYKKITQYYVDSQREIIAMLREDVTEIIHEEAEKNKILADALEVANQASNAKSQFLSNISHELRTPLNAIIGFMELAKGADADAVEKYLANSDIAAKQLLSIINDVLDVSSIEAGKMKLAHTPFDFKHLIKAVTNIYLSQCHEKGLNYETRMVTPVDEWLVGDQLRVNQILINLLNNAIKFTTEGHIWLTISQHDAQNDNVFIRFEVSDTGRGMTEEMQTRLFRPFEQESTTTAQKYGGSGLGLSIVKNLVNMMNGIVSVESCLGKGSTFVVELPFTKSEADIGIGEIEGAKDLHVLAVDDEEVERQYISTVLSRIGVRYNFVEDGDSALAELAHSERENDIYNICLIDWKLPNMNGLDITKRIREKYGKDVVVIIVSSYEHYQADEKAKTAGADMFISKPLFQSSLFDLFATLTGGRIIETKKTLPDRNFQDKRILLAEDNDMNRLVAEGIIKKFGIECEAAVDGQEAVNKFTASASGYYDAILMDIQMPNMDGFEATRVIRTSDHPQAGTVYIIALTANAFNEDIAKSLSGGMDDHVSKPIEPDVLIDALEKAFLAEKTTK